MNSEEGSRFGALPKIEADVQKFIAGEPSSLIRQYLAMFPSAEY